MKDKFIQLKENCEKYNFLESGGYSFFVFMMIPATFIVFCILGYLINYLFGPEFAIWMLFGCLGSWGYLGFLFPTKIRDMFIENISGMRSMHMVMFDKKETNKYSSIADIVKVSEKLYNFIIKLLKVRKYLQMLFPISYYIVKNGWNKRYEDGKFVGINRSNPQEIFFLDFNELIKYEVPNIINRLNDLRSDLYSRLKEGENILISAKSDVAKNLTGTSELVKVSELQQARLDSQIAEFEKLQKILVKV